MLESPITHDDFYAIRTEVIFFSPTLPKGVTAMNAFEEITRLEGLPRVGETVRSKDYGTLWRVMEKREVWQTINDPETGEPPEIPAIYLS